MMDRNVELAVSQAVMATSVVERALHDPGPWTIAWGEEHFAVLAQRTVTRDGIIFTACFGEHCWLVEPEPILMLQCRGETLLIREQRNIGDGAFEVTLRFRVKAATADVEV